MPLSQLRLAATVCIDSVAADMAREAMSSEGKLVKAHVKCMSLWERESIEGITG